MMTASDGTQGRRERNKQEKLARIVDAADALFSRYGVDEVTTQQIAEAADIGTGTLFLYARNKAELLLLVQNAHYAESIERGLRTAADQSTVTEAVMAVVDAVVECNRRQVENGRSYMRELLFGDPDEPHHRVGLNLVEGVNDAYARMLREMAGIDDDRAPLLARMISAVVITTLASPAHLGSTNAELSLDIRAQLNVLLPR